MKTQIIFETPNSFKKYEPFLYISSLFFEKHETFFRITNIFWKCEHFLKLRTNYWNSQPFSTWFSLKIFNIFLNMNKTPRTFFEAMNKFRNSNFLVNWEQIFINVNFFWNLEHFLNCNQNYESRNIFWIQPLFETWGQNFEITNKML